MSGYATAHLGDVRSVRGEEPADWRAVRHQLGVSAFGVNAFVGATAGDVVVEEHDEAVSGHEELYFVASGRAAFEVAGDALDAPAATFVFVSDPSLTRAASAREPETTVLAVGGTPGRAFEVSEWEGRRLSGPSA